MIAHIQARPFHDFLHLEPHDRDRRRALGVHGKGIQPEESVLQYDLPVGIKLIDFDIPEGFGSVSEVLERWNLLAHLL